MIARMPYVMCDECGNPGPFGDDAKEARTEARRQGFTRDGRRDLCRRCSLSPEERAYEDTHARLQGYQTAEGCDCLRCMGNRSAARVLANDMARNYGQY